MPALAVLLGRLFALPAPLYAGLVLLGIISGGQASNLCTLIAGGDVALSVMMTTASTILSAIALPALSTVLIGQVVYVKTVALAKSLATLVLLPVLIGALVGAKFPGTVKRLENVLPLVGIAAVLVLILGPVSSTAALVGEGLQSLIVPVTLLHAGGGVVGFAVVRCVLKGSRKEAITAAFETGFKSPALSFVLAQRHFAETLVRMPSVVSIVVLAPFAAGCAVLLRALLGGQGGGGGDGGRTADKQPTFERYERTAGREATLFCVCVAGIYTKRVPLECLGAELVRARQFSLPVRVTRLL
ncbi:Sodium/pyruvate cotransporter BASS2, chloroplastic [Gracilariopsis chorda]|uniref:Sodium/pyruvate cotransporter BASS2, chloroplastic n=1 Tax=Gracilariopsis chorda TaxID=448386 RepID=A0A2V3IN26_9FLOR|nr:Sodium/pyruvate cotransporter BASS2, chloroplastic [Gracilariopsis chorda]|eukprot:PXF43486.1 Sodium/pyruvate cotransporter BASS2, chloroplastic [Gracilariopsis chorda]